MPAAHPTGEIRAGEHQVVPAPAYRCQQVAIVELHGDVDRPPGDEAGDMGHEESQELERDRERGGAHGH